MLIPTEWLREYVDTPADPESLAERLTATGNEIEELRPSADGPVFYLKLTPNRPDMLSIRGAAREVAALYGTTARPTTAELQAVGSTEPGVRVEVEAADLCPRYAARVIRRIRVGPSPDWLRRRLEAVGIRSISNVVDITNYVMFELGQPLHAFDLDLLREARILVRRARAGEGIEAIDGTRVQLEPEMLVIADGERPVAIAGVMGGSDTEVSGGTTSVLLESAYFQPTSVRRTSKRVGIASAASYRFERGVDPEGVVEALDRAAALIAALTGGMVSKTLFDVYPIPLPPASIGFRPARCRALLGVAVTDAEAAEFLQRLGVRVEGLGCPRWTVTAPSWRPDLVIEEDFIEEVGRLYGYDRLPETLPVGASGAGARSALEELTRRVREALLAQGLYEAVSSTLVARSYLEKARLTGSPAWEGGSGSPVSLRNPLSEEFDTLRPSLLPGLLQAAAYNLRHGVRDVFLYEAGYGHRRQTQDGEPQHRFLVAGLLLGSRWASTWNADRHLVTDFFAARGAVEGLIAALGAGRITAVPAEHSAFHPGRSAWLDVAGSRLGLVGELHPTVATGLDLPRGVYLFELDGDLLLQREGGALRYAPPTRFPCALRDLALVVDHTVASARIEEILRESLGAWGRSVRLFDVYTGSPLPEDRVSLAYALELGADDRTLTDAEVDARITAARERLRTELGAEFRG